MRSSEITAAGCPVLAAGVGVRRRGNWVLRAGSFRLECTSAGRPAIGIAPARPAAGSAVVSLLAGLARPSHGELRVLGEDLTTRAGRAAVRPLVGVAHRPGRRQPGRRVRGVVEHAARAAGLPARDRSALIAAILDRLALSAWGEVPAWSAPPLVNRTTRLAAAAVHQPELLLLDGLLDGLGPRDAARLAESVRGLARDSTVIMTGSDTASLALACDEVLMLTDGVLVRA